MASSRTGAAMLAASVTLALSSAGPALADNYVWAVYPLDGGRTHLSYGVPETDDIAIGFTCRRGSGRALVALSLPGDYPGRAVGSRWPVTVNLHSGAIRRTYRFSATMSELGAGVQDQPIALSDPLVRAFIASGRMGDARGDWPAETAGERRAIRNFFAGCARR